MMRSFHRGLLFSSCAALLFISGVQGQNATTISATGCVDVSGMQSCLDSATSRWETCTSSAGNNEEVIACSWARDVDEIGCYLQSCWNKVYSCEYQLLVGGLLYQQTNLVDSVPFWPAPDNAPGGCACNFGKIYENATASVQLVQTECPNYVTGLDESLEICQCCAWSAAVSAFYGICPGYDLTNYGLSSLDNQASSVESIGGSCAGLTSSICLGEFGIGSADDGTYVDPANAPSPGTKALSTTEGPGPLTTPPGGATMTVTLLSSTFTVTAATYNAKAATTGAAGATTTASGSSDSQGSGSGSGSETSSSASATKTNSASAIGYAPMSLLVSLALMLGL